MKTGMLYDKATIRVIVSTLKKYYVEESLRLVCDSVWVSTSGHAILVDNAVGSMIDEVLPFATLITPYKSEVNSFFRIHPNHEPGGFGFYIKGIPHPRFKSGLAKGWTRNDNDDGGPWASSNESCDLGVQARTFGR